MLAILNKIYISFLLLISITLVLTALGWVRLLVVKTGSMTPKIGINSLVVIIPKQSIFNSQKIFEVGQVISFKSSQTKELITHRIVGISKINGQTFYRTKGDANQSADVNLTSTSNVYGRLAFAIPSLGTLASFLRSFPGLFLLVILPASFIILNEVLVIQKEFKKIEISKKTLSAPFLIFLFLFLTAVPVVAFFTSQAVLETNSLTTAPTFLADHLVINEVYYQVDSAHGFDSPKDRNKVCGSVSNLSSVGNSIFIENNTGGNSENGNTSSQTNITTGTASSSVSTNNNVNSVSNCGKNNEWVEIFNPTETDINLKNWSLTDNSGNLTKINANKILKAKSFALVSKDSSTWKFWNVPTSTLTINLGKEIGDGLNNSGDRLILKDTTGVTIDQISWGNDVSILNPSITLVAVGKSFSRNPNGFDTDLSSNFVETLPAPGT